MQALRIEVDRNKTKIVYIDNGNKIFSHESPIGDEYNKLRKYNKHAGSDWASYIMWCLQCISYVDRIPERIYLSAADNSVWYSSVLNMQSYAQFFIKNISDAGKPYVIIEDNNSSQKDERYKKAISKFKI